MPGRYDAETIRTPTSIPAKEGPQSDLHEGSLRSLVHATTKPAPGAYPLEVTIRLCRSLAMKILPRTAIAVLAVPLAGLPRWPSAATTGSVDVGKIDAYVQAQVRIQGIPGLSIGLVHGHRIVHVRGFGKADDGGRPVTPNTPFILASISKPLTALAVMQLVEAGKVHLDTPVQHYLPRFRVAAAAASSHITVRHLLKHTSGLPVSSCELEVATLEQFVRSLRAVRLDRPVGSRHEYCSGNYNVLGLLVQMASGEPYSTYMERHVFDPLQMHHSYATESSAKQDGLAQGHTWLFGRPVPVTYYNLSDLPAGYLISSAEDMTHWLVAEMNGGRYGSHSILAARSIAATRASTVPAGDGMRYGLGWMIGHIGGVPAVYHYGDNYNFHGLAFIETRSNWGAIILVNGNGVVAIDALHAVEAGIARMLDGRAPEPGTPLSLPALYGIVDAILVVLTILVLLPLLRLRRWYRGLMQRRSEGRTWHVRTSLRIALEVVLPVGVVLAVYLFFRSIGSISWSQTFHAVPDLVSWVLAVSAMMLLAGTLRAALTIRILTAPGRLDLPVPQRGAPRSAERPNTQQ